MRILVTGGTGYIGSHTAVELLAAGHDALLLDNLSNSGISVLDRIERIAGRRPDFACVDVRDRAALRELLERGRFDCVLHFAGLKQVRESLEIPLAYYDSNVLGTVSLLECMSQAGPRTLVFSSSASVYDSDAAVPIGEGSALAPATPYGRTKLMIENILCDVASAETGWRIGMLRYFNPAGAHVSGLLGEDPAGAPSSLIPRIAQVAAGGTSELLVYGGDYPTPDGTPIRDYVHVVDIARGHLAAIDALGVRPGVCVLNLGTGRGHSVLEVVQAFTAATGAKVPYRVVERRPGDVARAYADPSRAREWLGWQSERGIDAVCADTWRWQQQCSC